MSSLDHIVLYIVYFGTLFVLCYNSRTNQSKWQNKGVITLFIILFIIIEGSRYGRGPDWINYKDRFEHISFFEPQKGFLRYMLLLKSLGFNYILYYMTNAAIFIVGLFYFIKKAYLPKENKWMPMIAICALMIHAESEIRQYIAFPFLLWALSIMLEKKEKRNWVLALVLVIITLSIHSGWFFSMPFLIISYLFIKKTISPWLSILLLFSAYYIIPSGYFGDFFTSQMTYILNLSSVDNDEFVGTHYIRDADRWLGTESVLEAAMQSALTKFLQFIFECGIIIASYIALIKYPNQKVLFFYNLFLVSAFIDRVMFGYEIFQRLTRQLYVFWFVPMGYALAVFPHIHGKPGKIMRIAIIISIIYLTLYWGRWIFLNPAATFVWNH